MYFIGDCHGDMHYYRNLVKRLNCSLQVGDFGIFDEDDAKKVAALTEHKFFRGNHDNPELCRQHPNYLGDYGYRQNIEMFWVAGGFSIDRDQRVAGVTWWEDEELSWSALKEAIEYYGDWKPKIMVSHECPSVIKPYSLAANPLSHLYGKGEITSRTENALQAMLDIHRPEIWIYGHYHYLVDEVLDGTRFVGLADSRMTPNDVFEIPGLEWI